jgi:hypothetical protein
MNKTKYLVTVINGAGDYIEHKYFSSSKKANKHIKNFGSHCIVEIWKIVKRK